MTPVIQVDKLAKCYALGRRASYSTIRESLMNSLRTSWRRLSRPDGRARPGAGSGPNLVWALRDVSFEVKRGEVLGIIGSNGAGKSTLLKIISRITEPSAGWVEVAGRVGSLLEVGTGFHPELTGRENIYLNGAVLGMRGREIDGKFGQIVSFAEVERFLDTPIKHYSSGMRLRLAFAVAAHLEPEILLVDEVLAVGDAAFQKKCLAKMNDVAGEGRTVLFVSHNMAAVESLCSRGLLLSRGELVRSGNPADIIHDYLTSSIQTGSASVDLRNHPGRTAGSAPIMTGVELSSESGNGTVRMGSDLRIHVSFSTQSGPLTPILGLVVKSVHGAPLFTVDNFTTHGGPFKERTSQGVITCHLETLPLMPGTYFVDLYFGDNPLDDLDMIEDAISFEVLPVDVFGTGRLPDAHWGPIFWPAKWHLGS